MDLYGNLFRSYLGGFHFTGKNDGIKDTLGVKKATIILSAKKHLYVATPIPPKISLLPLTGYTLITVLQMI